MDIESNSKESEKMVAEISPLLKFVLELGPLMVFFSPIPAANGWPPLFRY